MEKLTTFQVNDNTKLFDLTKKLNKSQFFKNFLNESQHKLLEYLIGLNNTTIWRNFLEGRLYLTVTRDGDGINESESAEADDIDIEEGIKTSKRLALHIRYLLYEKAIDFYYFSKRLDESVNAIDEVNDDYELLDSLNVDEVKEQGANVAEKEEAIVREEDDDYDDDDDEEEEEEEKDGKHETEGDGDGVSDDSLQFEGNQLVLEIPRTIFTKVETNTEPQADSNDNQLEDQENLFREFNKVYHNFEFDRETLIKRRKLEKSDLKLQNNNDDETDASKEPDSTKTSSNIEFSLATGSSLKHLLGTIQTKRESIPLNDYELRTLFMDVKKNKGKWANDERIGQEELYDACEKVVLELRSYTEHSTPFLNKVSKREAPNYGLIVKKPMDLNTVMKKLKNLQYNTKQEFVDDLMLIWSNCLLYNSDPKHFLRTHATAMQKKSLKLIPHIPNIIIKNRGDLEKEEDKDEGNNDTSKGKSSKKGRKRTRNEDIKLEHQDSVAASPDSVFDTPMEDDKVEETPVPATVDPTPAPEADVVPETNDANNGNTSTNGVEEEEDEEENEEMNDENNNQNEEDEVGPELQAWRTLTAKSRAHYCSTRAELFDEQDSYKLRLDAPAIYREPNEMSNFNDYITNKSVVSKGNLLENDEPYLLEYDITGGLPGVEFKGIGDEEQDQTEKKIVDSYVANKIEQKSSQFVLSTENGLNSIYMKNLTEMQEIRKVCFKISLIRQMQTQSFVHHTQMRQPEVESVKEVDLDPISRLDTHDTNSKAIQFSVLKRNISKIVMQTGFEKAEPSAVNTLTQLAEKYLGNLVKSVKSHSESTSKNKLSTPEVILVSLIENGVNKPDDLYTYANERLVNQYNKLVDLRVKLSNFLKELLRPGLENFNEKSFTDNSEQFMTGDFSNDLGDDFFGFKELGLDKEFNMLSSSIPIYLLHSRLHTTYTNNGAVSKAHKYDDLQSYKPNNLYGSDVASQIGILQPFYTRLLERSKANFIKQQKKNGLSTELPEMSKLVLMDDEILPQKQRNIRPRLPPTGKISSVKKKLVAHSFFITEPDQSEAEDASDFDELDAQEIETMMNNLDN